MVWTLTVTRSMTPGHTTSHLTSASTGLAQSTIPTRSGGTRSTICLNSVSSKWAALMPREKTDPSAIHIIQMSSLERISSELESLGMWRQNVSSKMLAARRVEGNDGLRTLVSVCTSRFWSKVLKPPCHHKESMRLPLAHLEPAAVTPA